jgi:hypothetical protein
MGETSLFELCELRARAIDARISRSLANGSSLRPGTSGFVLDDAAASADGVITQALSLAS